MVINIVVNYCCTRVLYVAVREDAKKKKKTETKKQ